MIVLLLHRGSLLVIAAALCACADINAYDDYWNGMVVGTTDDRITLALDAGHVGDVPNNMFQAYANVDPGTAGELEIAGPTNLLCKGTFRAISSPQAQTSDAVAKRLKPYWSLPMLDVGGSTWQGPAGTYSFTLRVAGHGGKLTKRVELPKLGTEDITPSGCSFVHR